MYMHSPPPDPVAITDSKRSCDEAAAMPLQRTDARTFDPWALLPQYGRIDQMMPGPEGEGTILGVDARRQS